MGFLLSTCPVGGWRVEAAMVQRSRLRSRGRGRSGERRRAKGGGGAGSACSGPAMSFPIVSNLR